MRSLSIVRQAIGTALYPLEVIAMAPRDGLYHISDYFTSLSTMKQQNEKLAAQQTLDARALQQGQQLLAENAQLRRLLGTAEHLPVKSIMGEILYDTRDAFTRKIVLDRGMKHGVALGQPVIDHAGVVGQVTRVFPFTSEVTLLTDKDQTIPVQVVRSGLRSVTYGRGQSNMLDLRFMPTNADIQKGDVLVTSGIDGIYPPGLAVATVVQVDVKSADAFARILCQPSAGVDRNRQLLILLTDNKIAERPPAEDRDKNTKGGILRHASNRTGGTPTRGQDVQPVPSPDIQPETTQR
jgi:rod shape-determining protein MreC